MAPPVIEIVLRKLLVFSLILINLHFIFSFGSATGYANAELSISGASIPTPQRSAGCPYTFTKAFIGRQTAFISNTFLLFAGRKSTSAAKSTRSQPLSELRSAPFASQRAIETSLNMAPDSLLRASSSSPIPLTRLYASTEEKVAVASGGAVADTEAKDGAKKPKRMPGNLEVVVIGLSHHNARVDVREKLAIPEDQWNEASTALCEYGAIEEASVLSTCNRFEIYLAGHNQYECIKDAIDFLMKRAGGALDQETLRRNIFILSGEDAIWHLLRVSAGLDSLVVGEGQILAQVKRCFERSMEDGSGQGGKVISRLLNTAVSAGKRVRSETGISKGAVSISSAAAEFTAMKLPIDCKIKELADSKIVIIGAGKMARLLLVHLDTQDVKEVTIVNRSPERVIELQNEFPSMKITLKLMDEMWNEIREADVVYPSTAATTTIIDPSPLADVLKTRQRKSGLVFVDISVPRNVHPDCGEVPGVFSYNVDDLKIVVERNTAKRRREMIEAEVILREEQGKFRLWQQSLGALPTIAKLQEKAETLRLEELQKASKKLSKLTPKDLEAVDRLSKGIVAKLLHGPMSHLRQQKEGDATRAAIEQVQLAFQLEQ